MKNNIVGVYHIGDLDGVCSGAIIKYRFGEDCRELIPINYGWEFPYHKIDKDTIVYMSDFSMQPFEDMLKIKEACKSLIWIDHHQSSIEAYNKLGLIIKGKREIGKAGCELTWEYLFPNEPTPRSVYLIGRYDVWQHDEDDDALPFQYGMRNKKTWPIYMPFWSKLFTDSRIVPSTVADGKIILEYQRKNDEGYCRAYSFETKFEGYKAIVCNKGYGNSKLFDSVYDPIKHDLMIMFVYAPKIEKWKLSFYTTKDIDLSKLAEKYGGGGHKQASGAEVDILPFKLGFSQKPNLNKIVKNIRIDVLKGALG